MVSAALRFKLDTLPFLDAQDANTDKLVELRSKPSRQLLVWQPDAVADIFRSEHAMRLDGSETLGPLGGRHSLLFANGERHTSYRRVIGARLRGKQLATQHETIREVTAEAVDALRPGSVIDLPSWTRALTLRIVSRILFGHTDSAFLGAFTEWLDAALGTRRRTMVYRYLRPPGAVPSPWRTFQQRREALCQAVLRDARHPEDGSLLAELSRPEAPLGRLTDAELTDQVLSLLFAGHETTASAITSALYWLGRDDCLTAKIRAEVGDGDASDADEVPLLEATCREVLRISPPAMVAGNRVLTEDRDLFGTRLAAGTRLTPCIYSAHRQPDVYPDPHRFDPGRFLGQRHSAQKYLPFGGGTRRCLGADLATLEMRMIVAAVLRARDVRVLAPEQATFALRGQALCFGPSLLASVGGAPCG
ncbi:cytochrome P450 [Lentzea tibetensis]|uniref:Cytochrome P450 n=1 Tax=Lentzea tibetensis TaxID=2591470 RepID=A0A563EJF3_9PSEU|nr:cytochrome P450 [Lentzea tibetensis]TWP46961.1 cytochrome P450 [Lentzea tibetensis]